jgi:hypothetical protein
VLQRLRDKNQADGDGPSDIQDAMTIDAETTPLLARAVRGGHHLGTADENNFDFGLECILDQAERLIEANKKPAPRARKAPRS